jgi:uncharacterized repeat protein (TIGR03803 family)
MDAMSTHAAPRPGLAACLTLAVALAAAPADAATLKTLVRFNLANGANPGGALTLVPSGTSLPAGALLGTAAAGGGANRGTLFALMPPAHAYAPWTLQTVFSFSGKYNLAAPIGGMTLLSGGVLAGAASAGGPYWSGGVYTITPPAAASARLRRGLPPGFLLCLAYLETEVKAQVSPNQPPTLEELCAGTYGFTQEPAYNGPIAAASVYTGSPTGAPVADGTGGLYEAVGTSSPGTGAVVHLTPPSQSNHVWPPAILYVFGQTAGDLSFPSGPLIVGAKGELYGAALSGGAHNAGGIYRLTPPANTGGQWTEDIIWSFGGAGDGAYPAGDLLLGADKDIYGTTQSGGSGEISGTVFQLAPPASGQTVWHEAVLYSFAGNSGGKHDGATPVAGLFRDHDGNLFGTTRDGGANFDGTIYKLTKPAAGATAWQETILWNFTGGDDGAVPLGKLVPDTKGHLFGTTSLGGQAGAAADNELQLGRGYGTVFQLTP